MPRGSWSLFARQIDSPSSAPKRCSQLLKLHKLYTAATSYAFSKEPTELIGKRATKSSTHVFISEYICQSRATSRRPHDFAKKLPKQNEAHIVTLTAIINNNFLNLPFHTNNRNIILLPVNFIISHTSTHYESVKTEHDNLGESKYNSTRSAHSPKTKSALLSSENKRFYRQNEIAGVHFVLQSRRKQLLN